MRPDAVTWGPKEFILGHLGLTLFTQKSYVVACRPNAVTWEPNAITREPNAVPWRSNFITRGFTELAFASYAKQRGVIRGAKRFFPILKEFVSFNCDSSAVFDSILTSKMCFGNLWKRSIQWYWLIFSSISIHKVIEFWWILVVTSTNIFRYQLKNRISQKRLCRFFSGFLHRFPNFK